MKDRRLKPNGEIEEWERPKTIPDDFIYDPEVNGYYPPGEGSEWDAEAWLREFNERKKDYNCGSLFTVDELRAAGALDVPPAWRKSLGGRRVERDLFSDLVDDDVSKESAPPDPESNESAE